MKMTEREAKDMRIDLEMEFDELVLYLEIIDGNASKVSHPRM